jgi:hypothetical protein
MPDFGKGQPDKDQAVDSQTFLKSGCALCLFSLDQSTVPAKAVIYYFKELFNKNGRLTQTAAAISVWRSISEAWTTKSLVA